MFSQSKKEIEREKRDNAFNAILPLKFNQLVHKCDDHNTNKPHKKEHVHKKCCKTGKGGDVKKRNEKKKI